FGQARLRSGPRTQHDGEGRRGEGGGNENSRATERKAATSDRLLEEAVRERGDAERDCRAERVEPDTVDVHPLGREDEVDRPVPEVRAVAHRPERAQRREG